MILNEWVDNVQVLLSDVYTPEMLAEIAYEYQNAQLLSNGYKNVFGKDFYLIKSISVINGHYLTVWRDVNVKARL